MPDIQGYSYDRAVIGSFIEKADYTWEGHKKTVDKGKHGENLLVTAGAYPGSNVIEVSWLKAASPIYQVSPNIEDYVFAEVPGCQANLPNRNLDAFPLDELLKFRPILGMQAYKSFTAKMCSYNHDNKDPRKAKGVCFDSYMQKINGQWHVKVLAGFDRSKDPQLAKKILKNVATGYSMACLIESARCSLCKNLAQGKVTCKHVAGGAGKGKIIDGQLVYEDLININFWELANVDDRADIDAKQEWVRG